ESAHFRLCLYRESDFIPPQQWSSIVMGSHGVYPHDIVPPKSGYYDSGRFGRLFGSLPSFASDTPQTRKALLDIGRPGGIMDAADDLSQTPADLIINLTLSQDNPDNPDLTAGFTFF